VKHRHGTLTLYKYSSMEISAYGNYLITAFLSSDYYTEAKGMILYSMSHCIVSVAFIIIFIISAIVEREETSESQ
ncbi:MAG: hypothetical protein WBE61_11285, partial [Nitrososphaeraceae archaeon]